MKDIANIVGCSLHKVNYWMNKHSIKIRSIGDAIYLKNNPNGDPFIFNQPSNSKEWELYGFGLGLYWGEGTKADKGSVRLGNSDPGIIRKFMEFLILIFKVERKDFKFGLQLFNDVNKQEAMDFWTKCLTINKRQFYKVTVSPSVSRGTYRKKARYGVLTVYYHNKKLRDLLVSLLPM
jgi:hypothetical protein